MTSSFSFVTLLPPSPPNSQLMTPHTATAHHPTTTTPLLDQLKRFCGSARSRFLELLLKPHHVNEQIATDLKSREDAAPMVPERIKVGPTPRVPDGPLLEMWRPTGAWRWTRGMSIKRCNNIINLTVDPKSTCKSYYGTGTIGSQELEFYCKSWPRGADEFKIEMTLYKSQLGALRGVYVPNIIGVYAGVDDTTNMLLELPHPQFWLEASDDMPDVLKKRCIDCFERIHAAGVLHGAPYLHNIFIGGDARVIVANFEHAAVLDSIPEVAQQTTTHDKLRMEMRQIKYLLNYDNARHKERQKWLGYQSRLDWNERQRQLRKANPKHVLEFCTSTPEEKLDPPVNAAKQKGWRTDKHKARRYVNPTISNESFAIAMEKFIENVRRMEREGDGPPVSYPPSPTLPDVRHLPSPPSDSVELSDDDEPSSSTTPLRRSTRKRKGRDDLSDSPTPTPKRRKKAIKSDPDLATPTTPPSKPIRLESFIVGSSKDHERDLSASPGGAESHVLDLAPVFPTAGPSTSLRSAIKAVPATFVTPPPEIARPPIAPRSTTARGKRKRRDDEEDGLIKVEEDESPLKRTRLALPSSSQSPGGKHVSFAPAPEVHLKKWQIPAEMLTPAGYKYNHGSGGFKQKRSRHSTPPSSPRSETTSKWNSPLPFRFVARFFANFVHRNQS